MSILVLILITIVLYSDRAGRDVILLCIMIGLMIVSMSHDLVWLINHFG